MADVLLICGSGEEVDKSISALRSAGIDAALVGIKGIHAIDPKERFEEIAPGEIGRLFGAITASHAPKVAMVGSFGGIGIADIVPDETARKLLLQRGLELEKVTLFQLMGVALEGITSRGAELVNIASLIPHVSRLETGFHTTLQWGWGLGDGDFQLARRVQQALAARHLYVGEAVVVRDNTIVGIEVANDDTDSLLRRIGRSAKRSGVLVKWPFFDLGGKILTSPTPTIGLKTAELANAANLAGIVIHPVTQVWDRKDVIHLLNTSQMFLYVTRDSDEQQ